MLMKMTKRDSAIFIGGLLVGVVVGMIYYYGHKYTVSMQDQSQNQETVSITPTGQDQRAPSGVKTIFPNSAVEDSRVSPDVWHEIETKGKANITISFGGHYNPDTGQLVPYDVQHPEEFTIVTAENNPNIRLYYNTNPQFVYYIVNAKGVQEILQNKYVTHVYLWTRPVPNGF